MKGQTVFLPTEKSFQFFVLYQKIHFQIIADLVGKFPEQYSLAAYFDLRAGGRNKIQVKDSMRNHTRMKLLFTSSRIPSNKVLLINLPLEESKTSIVSRLH